MIIPAQNEEENLGVTLAILLVSRKQKILEIIVVDDIPKIDYRIAQEFSSY